MNTIGQGIGWLSVYNVIDFEDPINICLEIENFNLLAEAKCHAVWKMIVHVSQSIPCIGTHQQLFNRHN